MSAKASADSLQSQIWRVVVQLDQLPAEPETGYELDALSVCFRTLCETREPARSAAEDQIWEFWCDHPQEQLAAQMALGIRLLAAGELAPAEAVFDRQGEFPMSAIELDEDIRRRVEEPLRHGALHRSGDRE